MFKEYILINPNNFVLIHNEEFDKLFDLLLINIPVKIKGQH